MEHAVHFKHQVIDPAARMNSKTELVYSYHMPTASSMTTYRVLADIYSLHSFGLTLMLCY